MGQEGNRGHLEYNCQMKKAFQEKIEPMSNFAEHWTIDHLVRRCGDH